MPTSRDREGAEQPVATGASPLPHGRGSFGNRAMRIALAACLLATGVSGCQVGHFEYTYIYENLQFRGREKTAEDFPERDGDHVFTSLTWWMPKETAGCEAARIELPDGNTIRFSDLHSDELEDFGVDFREHPTLENVYYGRAGRGSITIRFDRQKVASASYREHVRPLFDPNEADERKSLFVTCDERAISLPADEGTVIEIFGSPDEVKRRRMLP